MENKNKKRKSKDVISYLMMGLIFVCMILLVVEISINSASEIKTKNSTQNYSIVMDSIINQE